MSEKDIPFFYRKMPRRSVLGLGVVGFVGGFGGAFRQVDEAQTRVDNVETSLNNPSDEEFAKAENIKSQLELNARATLAEDPNAIEVQLPAGYAEAIEIYDSRIDVDAESSEVSRGLIDDVPVLILGGLASGTAAVVGTRLEFIGRSDYDDIGGKNLKPSPQV